MACCALVAEPRLTRQELGWLLAQEARGAAKSLRAEVSQLRASIAPPSADSEDRISVTSLPGEQNLQTLDQAISMLNQLETGPKKPARRSRLDLAALLYELAPNCRIALEPGAGTEVFGDEGAFRRLFHMLLNQGPAGDQGSPGEISIRRDGDWIRISVDLGPDTAATNDLERRWLSRMSQQQGGRSELQGRTQTIVLPAEQSSHAQVDELKKELDQAQQLGEVYARELASVVAQETHSSLPAAQTYQSEKLANLRAFATALLPQLDQDGTGPTVVLMKLSEADESEPASKVDLAESVAVAVRALSQKSEARRVDVTVEAGTASVDYAPSLISSLCTALLDGALSTTAAGGHVTLRVRLERDMAVLEAEGQTDPLATEPASLQGSPRCPQGSEGLSLLIMNAICDHINNSDEGTGAVAQLSPSGGQTTVTRVRLARPVDLR